MAWKQVKFETATKEMKGESYLGVDVRKDRGMIDEGKFSIMMGALKSNAFFKGFDDRLHVVFERREDGNWHLLGVEISKQELDPRTGAPLLPSQHQFYYTNPDYSVRFLILEEPLKTEVYEGIVKHTHLDVVKD